MQDIVRTEKRAGRALRPFIVGVLTIAAAVVADLLVRALAFAIWPISPTFLPLQVRLVSVFAAVLVGGGVLVYALVVRFSRHPARTFTMIALIAIALLTRLAPSDGRAAHIS